MRMYVQCRYIEIQNKIIYIKLLRKYNIIYMKDQFKNVQNSVQNRWRMINLEKELLRKYNRRYIKDQLNVQNSVQNTKRVRNLEKEATAQIRHFSKASNRKVWKKLKK